MQKCHLFINYKFTNPFLTTLQLGRCGSRVARLWICKFVNNKQMAFLQIFVLQQLLFLFSKHLDTIWMWRIVGPVKQIFVLYIALKNWNCNSKVDLCTYPWICYHLVKRPRFGMRWKFIGMPGELWGGLYTYLKKNGYIPKYLGRKRSSQWAKSNLGNKILAANDFFFFQVQKIFVFYCRKNVWNWFWSTIISYFLHWNFWRELKWFSYLNFLMNEISN